MHLRAEGRIIRLPPAGYASFRWDLLGVEKEAATQPSSAHSASLEGIAPGPYLAEPRSFKAKLAAIFTRVSEAVQEIERSGKTKTRGILIASRPKSRPRVAGRVCGRERFVGGTRKEKHMCERPGCRLTVTHSRIAHAARGSETLPLPLTARRAAVDLRLPSGRAGYFSGRTPDNHRSARPALPARCHTGRMIRADAEVRPVDLRPSSQWWRRRSPRPDAVPSMAGPDKFSKMRPDTMQWAALVSGSRRRLVSAERASNGLQAGFTTLRGQTAIAGLLEGDR